MARYKVLEPSLIGNEILDEGTEIGSGTAYPFEGLPGPNLEPLDDEGKGKALELVEYNKQRIRDMQAQNPFTATLDPEALGIAIAKAVTQAMTEQAAAKEVTLPKAK